jgi:hypothetical protein
VSEANHEVTAEPLLTHRSLIEPSCVGGTGSARVQAALSFSEGPGEDGRVPPPAAGPAAEGRHLRREENSHELPVSLRPSCDFSGICPIIILGWMMGKEPSAVVAVGDAMVRAATATGTPAFYTLIGAGLAAVASLAGVGLKSWLDGKAEAQRQNYELARLERQLAASEETRVLERRQRAYAEFLATSHQMYDSIRSTRQRRRSGELGDDEYAAELRALSGFEGQTRLEELRFSGPAHAAVSAENLWTHIRSAPVPRGADVSGRGWVEWKDEYWALRRAFFAACSNGLSPGSPGEKPDPHGGGPG